jgi:serine/threonine protein kinase/Tol biopolymer transport system component
MNEAPDQTNEGAAGTPIDDRLGSSEFDKDKTAPIYLGETERVRADTDPVRADTDPQPTTTKVFASDYQKVLPERYRLMEMIGRGGMAEVFLAEDTRLNRRVAIKFLSREFIKDTDRTRRFTREARAASALNHPNILIVHDIGESADGQYIVSEYVEGETLGTRIRRGRVPLLEATNIAIQVASALAASHKAGIVHRDVKPDNIMLRSDGSVKVLDFGLAKDTEQIFSIPSSDNAKTLDLVSTSPGLILGTPQYMSPEQTRGIDLDARTDIFSLGNIIFEMVTGHVPFPGKSMADILAAIISKEPRRLEEYLIDPPLKLITIVEKALRKEREERYEKMEHLLADLQQLHAELAAGAPRVDAVDTGPIDPRSTLNKTVSGVFASNFTRFEALLALLAVLGAVAFYFWWSLRETPQAKPVAASKATVPVTSWSSSAGESVAAASFSPDGRMVAYAATKGAATEIWVKPIAGGDSIQVTKNGFYNQYPVWSPNGQDVAFFSSRGNNRGIWRASFTGGEQVKIAGDIGSTARPVRWSPDGRIYFQDGSELFAADATTGKIEQLTQFAPDGLKPWRIAISLDGSSIAYSIKEGEIWKLRVMRQHAGSGDEIASSKRQIDDMAWGPDGKSIIFSGAVDGVYQIFERSLGSGEPVQLSTGDHDLFVKDVSPDGSKILYGSVNETSDLWIVDTRDSKESSVANEVANEFWAGFSPDGRSLVYQSVTLTERPYSGSINVRNIERGDASIVVSPEGFSPVWSPDGKWIAYLRRSELGIALWRVEPTGDDALKLADGEIGAPPYTPTPYLKMGTNHISWSPDSSTVAYSARTDGALNIWLVGFDGTRNVEISHNKDTNEKYCCPVWSAKGNSIAFVSWNDDSTGQKKSTYRLWLYDTNSSQSRILLESAERFRLLGFTSGAGEAIIARKADSSDVSSTPAKTDIVWVSLQSAAERIVNNLSYAYFHNIHLSPDGTNIAFVSRRDNTTALWSVPVSGGTPRKIFGENDPKILLSSLAWAPDGSSIVFGKQTRTNLLSMLTK